jgi:hypothetical protein
MIETPKQTGFMRLMTWAAWLLWYKWVPSKWQPAITAPKDGSWIELSGEPFRQAYYPTSFVPNKAKGMKLPSKIVRSISVAKWAYVFEPGKNWHLECWQARDGKYAFNCHEWRKIRDPRVVL